MVRGRQKVNARLPRAGETATPFPLAAHYPGRHAAPRGCSGTGTATRDVPGNGFSY